MSAKDTGGPAFPGVEYKAPAGGGAHVMTIVGGMTMRDYFAAKAMPIVAEQIYSWKTKIEGSTVPELTATLSYQFADAMLAERNK